MNIGDGVERAVPRPGWPHQAGRVTTVRPDGAGGRWVEVEWSETCTLRHRPEQLRPTGYRLAA